MRSTTVVKVIEMVGSSPKSWEDAIQEAVDRAIKTVRNVSGISVVGQNLKVRDGKVVEYRVNLKVAFEVEDKL